MSDHTGHDALATLIENADYWKGNQNGDAVDVANYLIANKADVFLALGLTVEHAIDKPGLRGINPQYR